MERWSLVLRVRLVSRENTIGALAVALVVGRGCDGQRDGASEEENSKGDRLGTGSNSVRERISQLARWLAELWLEVLA